MKKSTILIAVVILIIGLVTGCNMFKAQNKLMAGRHAAIQAIR